jgi:two-component system, NtrC family, nitrogen regulation sensor histidine kinase NtrY
MAETPADVRANRMDLVARWADDLAHEIKNPLHAMVINLELVKRRAGGGDPEALVDRIEVVESELHRVHTLVESLLRLVRPWPERQATDVDQVFQDILPVMEARARIRKVELRHSPGGSMVAMAPGLLTLVLLNLVDNALEASRENDRLLTACHLELDQVRITVRDTGAGLPDGPREALFEPGGSERPGHSGLGLAIARRLVREAGGELTLEAAPDGPGTVVTIVLPRTDAA